MKQLKSLVRQDDPEIMPISHILVLLLSSAISLIVSLTLPSLSPFLVLKLPIAVLFVLIMMEIFGNSLRAGYFQTVTVTHVPLMLRSLTSLATKIHRILQDSLRHKTHPHEIDILQAYTHCARDCMKRLINSGGSPLK